MINALIVVFISFSFLALCRWPSTTCQISGRYFNASKGINIFDTTSISASKMKMSKDYTGVSTKFASYEHLHNQSQAEGGQSSTDGSAVGDIGLIRATFDTSKLRMETSLRPECKAFEVTNGNIYFGEKRKDGFINMKFLLTSHATGFFELKEPGKEVKEPFEGCSLLIQQFQGVRPHLCASRWNLCYFVANVPRSGMCPPCTMFMIQVQTADSYDDATINYGAIFYKGSIILVSVGNTIEHKNPAIDKISGFPIPESIEYKWKGRSFDKTEVRATCNVKLVNQCARICLLDNVPYVIRKMIETFVAKPFVYQWLDDVEVEVKIGNESKGGEVKTEKFQGRMFQEVALI